MKKIILTFLALSALAGCRHPEPGRDYDSVRQRSDEQHQSHDAFKNE